MKIERLLGIITFLLNRDLVSGKDLADKFEVSERTIQRDIDSINLAGIPIASIRGVNGGYRILDTYKLSKQTQTAEDFDAIKMALESLNTALDEKYVDAALEKINSIQEQKETSYISVDFSVAKENNTVMCNKEIIQKCISLHNQLQFTYCNASGHESTHLVEPLQLKFKWYAWYMACYSKNKEDYRIYKLSRMTNVNPIDDSFTEVHNIETDLFEELMKKDERPLTKVILKCKRNAYIPLSEHFHNLECLREDEESFMVSLHVIESERLWFALLLSFGADIQVLEPKHIQMKFREHAEEIINIYKIPDR